MSARDCDRDCLRQWISIPASPGASLKLPCARNCERGHAMPTVEVAVLVASATPTVQAVVRLRQFHRVQDAGGRARWVDVEAAK